MKPSEDLAAELRHWGQAVVGHGRDPVWATRAAEAMLAAAEAIERLRADAAKAILLTDDFHQDEPLAWLVKAHDTTVFEYEVFGERRQARDCARQQQDAASDADEPQDWLVYPLYASHGEAI